MSRPLGSAGESGRDGGPDDPDAAACTVLEFIQKVSENVKLSDGTAVSAARFLEMFGFNSAYHRMDLSRLSGGEKRRLFLIRVLAGSPNFLVMDEPTNDLDLETLRKLEEYITAFKGCVIIVSHDRAFLDSATDYLFIFDGHGGIEGYAGSCSAYHEEENGIIDRKPVLYSKKPGKQSGGKISGADKPVVRKKLSFNEKRKYEAIFPAIEKLEKEKTRLENSFSDISITPEELADNNKRYKAVLEEIEIKTERWELSEFV